MVYFIEPHTSTHIDLFYSEKRLIKMNKRKHKKLVKKKALIEGVKYPVNMHKGKNTAVSLMNQAFVKVGTIIDTWHWWW